MIYDYERERGFNWAFFSTGMLVFQECVDAADVSTRIGPVTLTTVETLFFLGDVQFEVFFKLD